MREKEKRVGVAGADEVRLINESVTVTVKRDIRGMTLSSHVIEGSFHCAYKARGRKRVNRQPLKSVNSYKYP